MQTLSDRHATQIFGLAMFAASSRSASVKPAVQLQARDYALKEDAALLAIHTRSAAAQTAPKLRIGEGEHVGDGLGSRRRLSTGAGLSNAGPHIITAPPCPCEPRLCVFL